jgi:hypothetical protein
MEVFCLVLGVGVRGLGTEPSPSIPIKSLEKGETGIFPRITEVFRVQISAARQLRKVIMQGTIMDVIITIFRN